MKVLLFGKNSKNIADLVKQSGFNIVSSNPELVISYGGDGTLLSSEREFPGLPKLPLRNSQVCNKCPKHEDKIVLQALLDGKVNLKEYRKLETTILYKSFYALNDFVIRNSNPTHTIRFKLTFPMSSLRKQGSINNKLLIGDGIVLATPFGSTGYFKSVTNQAFDNGFGLAFNNTTEKLAPILFEEEDSLSFILVRGKATLSFDNSPDMFVINEGSEITFRLADQVTRIYEAESLRCPNCQVIRG